MPQLPKDFKLSKKKFSELSDKKILSNFVLLHTTSFWGGETNTFEIGVPVEVTKTKVVVRFGKSDKTIESFSRKTGKKNRYNKIYFLTDLERYNLNRFWVNTKLKQNLLTQLKNFLVNYHRFSLAEDMEMDKIVRFMEHTGMTDVYKNLKPVRDFYPQYRQELNYGFSIKHIPKSHNKKI